MGRNSLSQALASYLEKHPKYWHKFNGQHNKIYQIGGESIDTTGSATGAGLLGGLKGEWLYGTCPRVPSEGRDIWGKGPFDGQVDR